MKINKKIKSILIPLEICLVIFYSLATLGSLLLMFDIANNYATEIAFYIMGWPVFAGSFLGFILYYLILFAIPTISIKIYQKKYLLLNIFLLVLICAHLGLFIMSLRGLARL